MSDIQRSMLCDPNTPVQYAREQHKTQLHYPWPHVVQCSPPAAAKFQFYQLKPQT